MRYFLYLWNPNNWKWQELEATCISIANDEPIYDNWSCGSRRNISIGDRFILLKLGKIPNLEKGIIGCGTIVTTPAPKTHWDDKRAKYGATALGTDIIFHTLSPAPLISLEYLQQKFPQKNWTPRSSGTIIDEETASKIFAMISENEEFGFDIPNNLDLASIYEGNPKWINIKTYDRSSIARQDCLEHYGYNCFVCNFNFEKFYGEIGKNFIEVHHLIPISKRQTEYQINPIKDLRPVCSNCHRMLHRTRTSISIQELNEKLQKRPSK